jgi:hypothetical protein
MAAKLKYQKKSSVSMLILILNGTRLSFMPVVLRKIWMRFRMATKYKLVVEGLNFLEGNVSVW